MYDQKFNYAMNSKYKKIYIGVVFQQILTKILLANCTILLSDGTFKSARKLFYQLYVVFGVVDDRKLPLSWVLLKNKTTGIHRRMLKFFKRELQRKNLQLTVTEIVCNFELGFKSAIQTDYTQVRLWGCYFHFTKALLKKMKDLRLFIQYRDDPLLNGFLGKIFAIGYLPVFYVRQKFYQLTQSTNARFLKNAYPQLVFFLQYFELTWFTTFPPNLYNVYARPSTLRTINACEGYNNRFNVRVGKG